MVCCWTFANYEMISAVRYITNIDGFRAWLAPVVPFLRCVISFRDAVSSSALFSEDVAFT